MTDLHYLSVAETRALLEDRSISAVELVEHMLARIDSTEPQIHAYAHVCADRARADAAAADCALRAGNPGPPLRGIPVAVKDMLMTEGIPTEAGSRVLAGNVPSRDAAAVTALRQAGAVLLGKTVTHEFAYAQNVPATRNAWDTRCYPGSSSAGSGVAVAAGSTLVALGTDTGGSVRAPAAVNGVVGLKPSFDVVSRDGVIPMSPTLDAVGPIARTVEDCEVLLRATAPGLLDAGRPTRPPANRPFRIGIDRRSHFTVGLDPEVVAAVDRTLAELGRDNVELIDVHTPELELVADVGVLIIMVDTSYWHRRFLREKPECYDPATRAMLQAGEIIPATWYATVQRIRRHVLDSVTATFRAHALDAMALPTLPVTTFPLDEYADPLTSDSQEGWARVMHHTLLANLTGRPAVTVPCGLSSRNLPVGLELLGRRTADLDLLRLAEKVERVAGFAGTHPPETGLLTR